MAYLSGWTGKLVCRKLTQAGTPQWKKHSCSVKELARSGSWRELAALAGSVGGDFGAVAAEFHAAPAAGSVFGGVMEMQDTGFALTQAMPIESGEQIGGGISDRGK